MLAGSQRISKGKPLSEEARTLQQSQTSITWFSGHSLSLRKTREFRPYNVWELSERPMQATAAPRSENDQRPPSLETATAVRLSDLGWTACLCCSIVPRSGPRRSEGNTGLDRRAGRHRSLSKCATVLPHGDLARSPRRSRQRAKKGRFLGRRALRGVQPADANAGPVPASSRRQDRWQGRRLRVWYSTMDTGDNTRKDKRRAATEGDRRDARRQPANLEGKNPERRGSDASAIPDLYYLVFGALPVLKENKRVQAVQR